MKIRKRKSEIRKKGKRKKSSKRLPRSPRPTLKISYKITTTPTRSLSQQATTTQLITNSLLLCLFCDFNSLLIPKPRMFPLVTVDIDIFPNHSEYASNTVVINLKRERDDECDDDAPLFPITDHLILNNVVSFDPHKTQEVLYSTFKDDLLCSRICVEMAFAAQRVPEPFNMYLDVTQRFIGSSSSSSSTQEEEEEETCAICLEDISEAVQNYQHMQKCPHVFHDDCIFMWLSNNNTCPLCRTVLLDDDDDDDHPYYSDTEL